MILKSIENGSQKCQIDLILPTINGFEPTEQVFDSLKKQIFKDFRVIVIHQGQDDFDFTHLENLNYKYILTDEFGLSKGRNKALDLVQADFISFVDDDAFLPEDYLKKVCKKLSSGIDAICGIIKDPISKMPISRSMINIKKEFALDKKDFLYCVSSALSLSTKNMPLFDERLGLGADFGSGEEGEFFFKVSETKRVVFDPDLIVWHKNDLEKIKKMDIKSSFLRGFSYAKGHGAVFKIGLKRYKMPIFAFMFIKSLVLSAGSAVLYAIKGKWLFSIRDIGRLLGKTYGFFAY